MEPKPKPELEFAIPSKARQGESSRFWHLSWCWAPWKSSWSTSCINVRAYLKKPFGNLDALLRTWVIFIEQNIFIYLALTTLNNSVDGSREIWRLLPVRWQNQLEKMIDDHHNSTTEGQSSMCSVTPRQPYESISAKMAELALRPEWQGGLLCKWRWQEHGWKWRPGVQHCYLLPCNFMQLLTARVS